MYYKFSEDDDEDISYCAASSLHEAFAIIEDEDDTNSLRKVFINLITDNSREILLLMNTNLALMITKYGNKHTIENFKGRTPYIDNNSDGSSKGTTPKSKPDINKKSANADFSSALIEHEDKPKRKSMALTKKNTTLGITF